MIREVQYVLRTKQYEVVVSKYPNHPLQDQIRITDTTECETSGKTERMSYQILREAEGKYDDKKFYCSSSTVNTTNCGNDWDWGDDKFLAYLGVEKDGGTEYRRWRIANKAVLDSKNDKGQLTGWEVDVLVQPETESLRRIVMYDATTQTPVADVPSYTLDDFQQGATDAAVQSWLQEHLSMNDVAKLASAECPAKMEMFLGDPLLEKSTAKIPAMHNIFAEDPGACAHPLSVSGTLSTALCPNELSLPWSYHMHVCVRRATALLALA